MIDCDNFLESSDSDPYSQAEDYDLVELNSVCKESIQLGLNHLFEAVESSVQEAQNTNMDLATTTGDLSTSGTTTQAPKPIINKEKRTTSHLAPSTDLNYNLFLTEIEETCSCNHFSETIIIIVVISILICSIAVALWWKTTSTKECICIKNCGGPG